MKGKQPFSPATDGIAAERHFYSEPSKDMAVTLDDQITEYENRLNGLLRTLRDSVPGTEINANIAAEAVTHLIIRNNHIRGFLEDGISSLFQEALLRFCDGETLSHLFGISTGVPSRVVREEMRKFILENSLQDRSGMPEEFLLHLFFNLSREFFSVAFEENVEPMKMAFTTSASEAGNFVRKTHNKILLTDLAPEPRQIELRKLRWSTVSSSSLILPDCVVMGCEANGEITSLINTQVDLLRCVVMPLAPDMVLVGVKDDFPVPDASTLNRAAASASHHFFISSAYTDELAELSALIGSESSHVIEDAIENGFINLLSQEDDNGAQKLGTVIDNRIEDGRGKAGARCSMPERYQISFSGCADEETAYKISDVIRAVVAELSEIMPLSRLDGITFAADYSQALMNLDRGFKAVSPPAPTEEGYCSGVAMTPFVIRNDKLMGHLVARGGIAHYLISEDEDLKNLGLHTLVHQLAFVALMEMEESVFPGIYLRSCDDPLDAFLRPCSVNTWSGYFSARISAAIYPGFGQDYLDILNMAFEQAGNQIADARFSYRLSGDIDSLMRTLGPLIERVLVFSSRALGHFDGISEEIDGAQPFASALQKAGLWNWFKLFHRDLLSIWNRRGSWESISELLIMNRHVERLLWQFGIFPWKMPNGSLYITIPIATDAERLAGLNADFRPSL